MLHARELISLLSVCRAQNATEVNAVSSQFEQLRVTTRNKERDAWNANAAAPANRQRLVANVLAVVADKMQKAPFGTQQEASAMLFVAAERRCVPFLRAFASRRRWPAAFTDGLGS